MRISLVCIHVLLSLALCILVGCGSTDQASTALFEGSPSTEVPVQIIASTAVPVSESLPDTEVSSGDIASRHPAVEYPLGDEDIFMGLRVDDLAAREYGGRGITVGEVVKTGPGFTQYRMSYPSDGLTITGLVDIPDGEGPFPTIIVNHGYLRPVDYQPGFDSWRIADWLAKHGYIALMSDYRNYAGSDTGPNPFHIGYAIDVMNLVPQISSLPQAMPGQIGMIGHSMGGEIAMWPMVISDEVDAIILYASMSGDVGRNWAHARRHWSVQREAMDALAIIYGTPQQSPHAYAVMSPINYLDRVRMPVSVHHGTKDESVPYWWSEELWHLLEEAGADVNFWPYSGSGHTFGGRGFETFMQRNLIFLDEYVRADVNSPVGQ